MRPSAREDHRRRSRARRGPRSRDGRAPAGNATRSRGGRDRATPGSSPWRVCWATTGCPDAQACWASLICESYQSRCAADSPASAVPAALSSVRCCAAAGRPRAMRRRRPGPGEGVDDATTAAGAATAVRCRRDRVCAVESPPAAARGSGDPGGTGPGRRPARGPSRTDRPAPWRSPCARSSRGLRDRRVAKSAARRLGSSSAIRRSSSPRSSPFVDGPQSDHLVERGTQ